MPAFATTFIDQHGRRRRGRFTARDAGHLRAELRARALWPLQISAARPDWFASRLTIPSRDLVAVLQQLELQLRAGVTADEAFRQLADDTPPGALRHFLRHVHSEVSHGNPIHQACRAFPRLFPDHLAVVIEAGEQSARMPEALRGLAQHLASVEELRRTARRAMLYPVLVLAVTSGLIGFLLAGVVPRFAEIFRSLRLELPAVTASLITMSEVTRTYWLVLVAVALTVMVGLVAAARWPALRRVKDRLTLRIPILGDTIRHLATARMAAHCRLLHEAGVPLLDALAIAARLAGHSILTDQLLQARLAVAQGRPLYASFPAGHSFPAFVIPALKAGETTGQLGASLRHIEDYAATRARESLATALALLEPTLLALVAIVVGAIALSFFLPLVSLLGGVGAR